MGNKYEFKSNITIDEILTIGLLFQLAAPTKYQAASGTEFNKNSRY
jgi:hypothetical protein